MLTSACSAATWIALAAAVGCSTLPPPLRPPHRDHHVAAEFVVPTTGRLLLPTSSDTLLLQELTLDPPPRGEHWAGHERWFDYAPGTHVTLTSRFRTYGEAATGPANADDVLPNATRVRSLDAP